MCPLSNQRSRSLRTVTHNPLLCMISQRQPIIIHSNPRCDIVCDVITLTPLSNQSAGSSRVTNSRVVAVETGASKKEGVRNPVQVTSLPVGWTFMEQVDWPLVT